MKNIAVAAITIAAATAGLISLKMTLLNRYVNPTKTAAKAAPVTTPRAKGRFCANLAVRHPAATAYSAIDSPYNATFHFTKK